MLQFFSRLSFTCRLSLLLGVASKILKNASFYLYFCIRNLYANFEKGDTFYYMKTKKNPQGNPLSNTEKITKTLLFKWK